MSHQIENQMYSEDVHFILLPTELGDYGCSFVVGYSGGEVGERSIPGQL